MCDSHKDYVMTGNGKTVLVVEDSMAQAYALKLLFEQEGMQVLHAPNGRVGVDMAQQYTPDVIVLDIEMPEMDGFEACRQIKADPQTAHIPVVILTVHGDRAAVVLQGIDLGATDFIPKDPFSYQVILETLRQLQILGPVSREVDDRVEG
jgi:CheY-like chemotaxis protein